MSTCLPPLERIHSLCRHNLESSGETETERSSRPPRTASGTLGCRGRYWGHWGRHPASHRSTTGIFVRLHSLIWYELSCDDSQYYWGTRNQSINHESPLIALYIIMYVCHHSFSGELLQLFLYMKHPLSSSSFVVCILAAPVPQVSKILLQLSPSQNFLHFPLGIEKRTNF